VTHPKLRNRRVIRDQVRRHHAVGDVLHAGALDRARGAVAARVGIEQERHHHRRLVSRPAMAVGAIARIEGAQIHLGDRVEHGPHQVSLGHPLAQRRRHQEHLLTITANEAHSHNQRLPTRPDSSALFPTATHRSSVLESADCVPPYRLPVVHSGHLAALDRTASLRTSAGVPEIRIGALRWARSRPAASTPPARSASDDRACVADEDSRIGVGYARYRRVDDSGRRAGAPTRRLDAVRPSCLVRVQFRYR
jgi:hypothetical protein